MYLKREDLAHTGAHKINNALGQGLLAQRMGKRRIIAETGAGQHGVATATVCAMLGLDCVVYMGEEDVRRQSLNVFRMKLLGAEVAPVNIGGRTLKEAVSAAIRDWATNVDSTHYIIGSAVGPAPYPELVRDLQRVIGDESREQILRAEGRVPDRVIACVGGGSNAIGSFAAFIDDPAVELVGVEADQRGARQPPPRRLAGEGPQGRPARLDVASALRRGGADRRGAFDLGRLGYPGVGPEHAHLRDTGRARYEAVSDGRALSAFRQMSRLEGIIPALESSHAVAFVLDDAARAQGSTSSRLADAHKDLTLALGALAHTDERDHDV